MVMAAVYVSFGGRGGGKGGSRWLLGSFCADSNLEQGWHMVGHKGSHANTYSYFKHMAEWKKIRMDAGTYARVLIHKH